MDDLSVERVLRWAALEWGTAGLSDDFGAEMLASAASEIFVPGNCVIAGRVVTVRRQRSAGAQSSFATLYGVVRAGCVVLVDADPQAGAAFGSNLALAASVAGAQALLTNGVARDSARLALLGLPVACAGWTPRRPAAGPMMPVDQVQMFGFTWRQGDWLLRDEDGIARLDNAAAAAIAAEIAANGHREVRSLVTESPVGARSVGGE